MALRNPNAKYIAFAYSEPYCIHTTSGVCLEKIIRGFIVIEIATATVVQKYECT